MSWRFEYLRTSQLDATVEHQEDITTLIDEWTIDFNVGDEYFLQAGDIILKSTEPLPLSPDVLKMNWVVVYWSEAIYNVYLIGPQGSDAFGPKYDFSERSEGIPQTYTARLNSIQKQFFDDLTLASIAYTPNPGRFNSNLAQALVTIEQLRINKASPASYATDRVGISLSDIVKQTIGLAGFILTGYKVIINTVNVPTIASSSGDVPILVRGRGSDLADSTQDKINNVFSTDGVTFMKYDEAWKMLAIITNTLIDIKPSISSGELRIGTEFIPRIPADATGAAPANWSERTYLKHRYLVRTAVINGDDFQAVAGLGVVAGQYEKTLSVATARNKDIDEDSKELFLLAGQKSGGKFQVIDLSILNDNYVNAARTLTAFDKSISDGHGYAGKIDFEGQKPFDKIDAGGDTIQILRIAPESGLEGQAAVEGAVIT
jgi:hypothetical protein